MKRALPLVLLLLILFAACDNHPQDVLSRGKMEDVLYDYHIMQGIVNDLPAEEREAKAQDYMNAVFEKHGITEAQFDSSIVYYNRHTKDLHKIYSNLKERYTAVNEEIQLVNGNNDMMAIFSTGGDTTNLWNSAKLLTLRNKELLNKESFTIHADTSFRRRDQFILTLSPIFIKERREDYDINLHVGLSVLYASGKHIGTTRVINNNGTQQLTLQTIKDEDIKSITGFFYYKGKKESRNLCLIDNISLIRMHEKEPENVEVADTVKADSIATDTLPKPVERRLTPEERRLQNQSGEHIKIQSAPSVRTPNSIGPRRRKQ
ncbi:MAG: DUF4296 domain-containing protein [Bacteroidaceae bacterium]|nr:DUF4296 domain-containing protein [Bacteroidaceae bacterium]